VHQPSCLAAAFRRGVFGSVVNQLGVAYIFILPGYGQRANSSLYMLCSKFKSSHFIVYAL